jgi:hypothetical protein
MVGFLSRISILRGAKRRFYVYHRRLDSGMGIAGYSFHYIWIYAVLYMSLKLRVSPLTIMPQVSKLSSLKIPRRRAG